MKITSAIYCFSVSFITIVAACQDHSNHNKQDAPASGHSHHNHSMHDMGNMDAGSENTVPNPHENMLVLTERAKLLAGIQTDSVRYTDFRQSVAVLGMVAIDDNTVNIIAAKTEGRIEHLYQRNPGAWLSAGQPLYDLYSETLIADQHELVQLVSSGAQQSLIQAARNKLKLHGLTSAQISSVESSGVVPRLTTVYAATGGYISKLNIREGQFVVAGETLFEIASLDAVKVNARVYSNEIAAFGKAQSYVVTSESFPDKTFTGSGILNSPALEANSKVYLLPLRVENKDHLLRPGMMVNVQIETAIEKRLTVPLASIVNENGMTMVWILDADGMFSRRMVQTGQTNEHSVEIISGLQKGDQVVTNGVFLLNSEFILRKGANSMAGMEM